MAFVIRGGVITKKKKVLTNISNGSAAGGEGFWQNNNSTTKRNGGKEDEAKRHQRIMDLVDPTYELIDPTPNIHELFVLFTDQLFYGALGACTVEWSKRMTTCAGICSFHPSSGLCSIRLSEPLLKLRPRKDLIETLLHEMIHAYLFVTQHVRDRDGHGPNFQEHMHRINASTGTNITIFHSFHAEVALYKQHWWRCGGVCRERAPYHGWVKRAMNRAPGPNDVWWAQHSATCGGTFVKVKEPESTTKATKLKSESQIQTQKSMTEVAKPNIAEFAVKGHILGTNLKKETEIASTSKSQLKIDTLFPGKGHIVGRLKTSPPRPSTSKALSRNGDVKWVPGIDEKPMEIILLGGLDDKKTNDASNLNFFERKPLASRKVNPKPAEIVWLD